MKYYKVEFGGDVDREEIFAVDDGGEIVAGIHRANNSIPMCICTGYCFDVESLIRLGKSERWMHKGLVDDPRYYPSVLVRAMAEGYEIISYPSYEIRKQPDLIPVREEAEK